MDPSPPSSPHDRDAVPPPLEDRDEGFTIAALESHVRLLRQEVQRLQERSALCYALVEEAPVGIAVYSALGGGEDFVFVDLNPAGQRLVGMSRDAVLGRCLSQLFPGVRAMGLLDALETAWRTGVPQRLSPREYRDCRLRLWVENHVVRLRTGHVASVFLDVTPWVLRRMDDGRGIVRLRRLYQRLHEGFCFVDGQGRVVDANPALEALLGVACRTPLAGIGGAYEPRGDGGRLSPAGRARLVPSYGIGTPASCGSGAGAPVGLPRRGRLVGYGA